MNRIKQESLAWRNQSFDTELPEQALAELVAPRRPRILGRQKPAAVERLTKGLGSENMLPSSGNALGGTWVVGDTPWVWIWAPGAARAD
jgi:hypothetical protein